MDNRFLEIMLGRVAYRTKKKGIGYHISNTIGFILVMGFLLLMTFGRFL